ncbi:hypothetical protein LOK49_LG12G02525 [Camellia lanceoleosa]|uniref:Uncharacterized protein n=1 Tax=Camellia lanceoleosa TaxID=1840588 RepID=A0ACC0FRC8_9ERIC|nr:hypothetical protein LOK49_LG12G02525 [Camellia lanceoleosa]
MTSNMESLDLNWTLVPVNFRRELAKEVVELLTAAVDGAKSLIDASDRLILYVKVAPQLYLQQENRLAAINALQELAITTKAYRVQSRASIAWSSLPNEIVSTHVDGGKTHHHSIVSHFESHWSTLQMVVLREILVSGMLRRSSSLHGVRRHTASILFSSNYSSGQNNLAVNLQISLIDFLENFIGPISPHLL